MNESKASLSRANMYAHLGAQYCSNIPPQGSSGNYIVGELHTERTMLTREQIAARCRKQRLEAGLPVYDAPTIRSREAQPSQRDSLLHQATAMASRLWNTAETLLHALTPRIPGAAASALGQKGTGNTPDPLERKTFPLTGVDRFAELVDSLGLHASYSHQFVRLDASEPDSRASWMVTPSLDPATQAVEDLLVFLESAQPGNLQQADQLKMMLSYLFERGMRTFTASPDVLKGFPCSTEANCVPVQSICDGKVLLDTVLAAAGKGNVVILPADAIESLANMLSPAYVNATEDFVWVSASRMRALEPQYRINCPAQPSTTGPTSPTSPTGWISPASPASPESSCAEGQALGTALGFVLGVLTTALGASAVTVVFLSRKGREMLAEIVQSVPRQIGNQNEKDEKNDEAKDDKDYRMENMNNQRSKTKVDVEGSELEAISSSVEND